MKHKMNFLCGVIFIFTILMPVANLSSLFFTSEGELKLSQMDIYPTHISNDNSFRLKDAKTNKEVKAWAKSVMVEEDLNTYVASKGGQLPDDFTFFSSSPVKRGMSDRAKVAAVVLGIAVLAILVVIFVLLYEWNEDYSPVLYMCVSFLTFEARPVVKFFLGEKSKAIINALSGFSIAMFVAAVIWAAL